MVALVRGRIQEGWRAVSNHTPTTDEIRQSFVHAESSEYVATVPGTGVLAWSRVRAGDDVRVTRVRDTKAHAESTAEFDRWLARHDAEVERAAAEKAWDEGYGACWTFHTSEGMQGSTENPHRREEA